MVTFVLPSFSSSATDILTALELIRPENLYEFRFLRFPGSADSTMLPERLVFPLRFCWKQFCFFTSIHASESGQPAWLV